MFANTELAKLHAWYAQDRIVPFPATALIDGSIMTDASFHFFKLYMYAKDQQHLKDHKTHMTLQQVSATLDMDPALHNQLAPFITLTHLALTMPLSTAECERGFSALARIKSDLRNRLLNSTLSYLMMISIQGPTAEQLTPEWLDAVARIWYKQKDRRVVM